jgi:hypothetical protein
VVARGNIVNTLNSTQPDDSHRLSSLDFDGDGNSDITVYRDGIWYVIRSSDGEQTPVGWGGLPQDIPVPRDYDVTGINWGLYEPY